MVADEGFSVVVEKSGEVVFAAYKNVNILVWYSSATLPGVRLLDATVPARIEACPEGLSAVHIVTEAAGMPSSEARDAFADQVERWRSTIACVSVVIEKTGFFASALRSAITGILLVSQGRFPTRVHRSIGEAAVWLPPVHQSRTGVALEARILRGVMQEVRDLRFSPEPEDSQAVLSP